MDARVRSARAYSIFVLFPNQQTPCHSRDVSVLLLFAMTITLLFLFLKISIVEPNQQPNTHPDGQHTK